MEIFLTNQFDLLILLYLSGQEPVDGSFELSIE